MYSNMKRNIYRVLSNDTESYKVKQLSFEGNTYHIYAALKSAQNSL